jgi:hypothetical protein
MKKKIVLTALLAMAGASVAMADPVPEPAQQPESAPLKREMTVTVGPEAVFDKAIGKVMPALAGAKATHVNGRVGNEFVFWGYKLKDGSNVFFYACAPLSGVNCVVRRAAICDTPVKVLETAEDQGKIRRLNCRKMCAVDTPTSTPCCQDVQEVDALQLGLVKCE